MVLAVCSVTTDLGHQHEPSKELISKFGDADNQAAFWVAFAFTSFASSPSVNLMPVMTFGN